MNKIDIQLKKIKQSNRIGLMTHVVIGYPSLEDTLATIKTLTDAGSDFIELQIPFSDPIADGPTIMKASDQSLKNGTTIEDCLEIMKKASKSVDIPLLFMGYYNSIFHYGIEKFCQKAKEVGASGLIIPDIPPEEEKYEDFIKTVEAQDLYLIRVITPASSDERLKLNAKYTEGFVYCVSHFGITGTEVTFDDSLKTYMARVGAHFNVPKAVGFGISTRDQIELVKKHAEIAIVGSAIIKIIDQNQKKHRLKAIYNFITHLNS